MSITRRFSQGLGICLVAIALTTACEFDNGSGGGSDDPPMEQPAPVNDETPSSPDDPDENPGGSDEAPANPDEAVKPQLYWLTSEGDRLALVPAEVSLAGDSVPEQLEILLTRLFSESPAGELSSTIPPGTQLRSLVIQEDGIVVNLSEDFQFGGGSASMIGRLAQVLYTATSLDPEGAIWLQLEGEPLTLLGGEGLEIPQPLTRENFTTNFDL